MVSREILFVILPKRFKLKNVHHSFAYRIHAKTLERAKKRMVLFVVTALPGQYSFSSSVFIIILINNNNNNPIVIQGHCANVRYATRILVR